MSADAPAALPLPLIKARAGGRDLAVLRLSVVVALLSGVVGLVAIVGADARWPAALGAIIARRGAIPAGVPFAAQPTQHWANALVGAELVFHWLEAGLGDRGLVLAQVVSVALAFALLARDARAGGAGSLGTSSALAIAAIGAFGSLAVARVQMFSVILFPLMLALLRAQQRRPSRAIVLALPLLALWSNLHGAALCGLLLLWAYLALSRVRTDRAAALAVGIAAPVVMCLTPAGIHTIDYYQGLVTNVAAQRGVGLWAPLGASPLDAVLVAAALALAWRWRDQRPPLWEIVVLAALGVLTVKAARDGVWLLFMLAGPAARRTRIRREWNGLLPIAAALALALLAFDAARPLAHAGASPALVRRAVALAHGRPVLADAIPAEQVALAEGRIWAGNPLDAFSHPVQGAYLDWLAGTARGRAELRDPRVDVVLVQRGTAPQALTGADPAFVQVAVDGSAVLYVRRPRLTP